MEQQETTWRIEEGEKAYVVKLRGITNLETVERFHKEMASLTGSHKDIVIDCAEAEYLDGCMLQELVALRLAAESNGAAFQCTGESPTVRKYIQIAGLTQCLPWRSEEHRNV